ncbi:MAG: hypothetical protein B9S30_05850, partial [Verrucomicrobiia bacterium Tous-C5FEB]
MAGTGLCRAGVVVLIHVGQGTERDGLPLYLHLKGCHSFPPRKERKGLGGDLQFTFGLASGLGSGLASAVEVALGSGVGGTAEFTSSGFGSS